MVGWEAEVRRALRDGAEVKLRTADACAAAIARAAEAIAACLSMGGKLLTCGNGGSAADAQHIAAELVGRLSPKSLRPALAAVALTTDTSVLTALGNDFGFEVAFQRQVEALGHPGDALLAISTSGRSENVLRAVSAARGKGLVTIALSGGDGGALTGAADIAVVVPSDDAQRVQEAHIAIGHIVCSLVERILFDEGKDRTWDLAREAVPGAGVMGRSPGR
ncbi:MAG: SIS domain-containing protein [Chloroflexi bacterium]|nr:SIS domain-containing protein [Chloroflexota bacterium]